MDPGRAHRLTLSLLMLAVVPLGLVAQVHETLDEFTARITRELEQTDPKAAELFTRANAARDRGNLSEAEAMYRQVREAQPDFTHATRRLCHVVGRQGRRAEALALCREALELESSLENRAALIQMLVTAGEEPLPEDLREALDHARVVLDDPLADEFPLLAACLAAAANNAVETLRNCSARVDRVGASLDIRYYVAWMLRMVEGDYKGAEVLLQEARAAGMSLELYENLLQTTRDARPMVQRLLPVAVVTGGVWLAGLLLLLGAGTLLSHLTLRAARRLPTVASGESVGANAVLRKIYRTVLWLCCAYYYLSIPLVLVLVVALGGGLIYGFLAVGSIPVRLVAIVLIVVLVTVWAVIKSILVRARDEDPGEKLDTAEYPRLRAVLQEVASEIDTRPVDNVYLTPGTDLAVMERGGMLRQLRGAAERCLILGIGVIEGMRLGPFKAILGHEYGHFSNRDTAGGGFALAVRRSLHTMAQTLAAGGAATWYNPAWLFLHGFYRVFLRISQGASRLQEVLADRWAAFAYGAMQFEAGLRHVIERTVRFGAHADATVKEAVERGYAVVNFYGYRPDGAPSEAEIEQAVESVIRSDPSPYDSHPSPRERFEWVHAIESDPTGDLSDADESVWDLFENRGALELMMTNVIRKNVEASYGVTIPGGG